MRKNSSEFVTDFISEAGTFRINKDYFAFVELDDIACYIVADGIDSDEEVNSAEVVVNYIFERLIKKPSMSKRKLKRYIVEAHRLLNEKSSSIRLKASLVVLLTDYSKMIWASAGNTRLYHFRKGGFNFRSKDQSIAQMMADAGQISEDDISSHDERNNLTNYLGQARGFKPFISRKHKLNDKDVIVLCTAGFWENLYNIDMVNSLKDAKEPAELIEKLEDELLARQSKVINNYTMAAIFANKIFKENLKDDIRLRIAKKVAMILIPIVLVAGGFFIFNTIEASKAVKLVAEYEDNGDKYITDESYVKALEKYEEAQSYMKKVNDEERKDRIETKCRITNLIVKGDEFFNNRDFAKAKDNYLNARTQVEFELEDGRRKLMEKLDKKIDRTNDFISVFEKSLEGDSEFALGEEASTKANEAEKNAAKAELCNTAREHYKNAIGIYNDAKSLSEEIAYYDMKKDMEDKIKDTEAKIKDMDKSAGEAAAAAAQEEKDKKEIEKLSKQATSYVNDGNRQYNAGKYTEACISYEFAIKIYDELKEKYNQDTTKDSYEIKLKITAAEKKIEEQKISQ